MTLQRLLDSAAIRYRRHQAQCPRFEPKVRFCIEANNFVVKTAETAEEFQQVLKLRYNVFIKEGLHKKKPIKVDVESWDFLADHLIVVEKATQKIAGTYRLISSKFSDRFYSQSEFEMDDLLKLPGNKLELGRACIDKDFRAGIVMTLLWRGLVRMIQETDSRYLFGCTSIKTTNPEQIAQLTRFFMENGHLSQQANATPLRKYTVKDLPLLLECCDPDFQISEMVPPLMNSYLKAGAKVCGMPAIDKAFKCVDFLTLLDTTQITEAYERKYKVC